MLLGEGGFGECQALGFLDADGVLEAGIVYHNWRPSAGIIEISAASINRRWGTRGRLNLIFDYPFNRIGCQMVVARHSEHNPVRRIWKALGASEIVIPRLRGRDEAECVATLTVEAWRTYIDG